MGSFAGGISMCQYAPVFATEVATADAAPYTEENSRWNVNFERQHVRCASIVVQLKFAAIWGPK